MSAADDGSKDRIAEFTDFRKRMNERILGEPNQVVRRFSRWTRRPTRPARWT